MHHRIATQKANPTTALQYSDHYSTTCCVKKHSYLQAAGLRQLRLCFGRCVRGLSWRQHQPWGLHCQSSLPPSRWGLLCWADQSSQGWWGSHTICQSGESWLHHLQARSLVKMEVSSSHSSMPILGTDGKPDACRCTPYTFTDPRKTCIRED